MQDYSDIGLNNRLRKEDSIAGKERPWRPSVEWGIYDERSPWANPTTIVKGNIETTGGGTFTLRNSNGVAQLSYVPSTGAITLAGAVTFNGETTFNDELSHEVITQTFSANRATGGTATSSLTGTPAGQGAGQAFDGSYTTKFLGSVFVNPSQLAYQFAGGSQYIIRKYAITTGDDNDDRDPRTWNFQGSVAGGTAWETIETRTNVWLGARRQRNEFFVDNGTAYDRYRLNITANWDSTDLQISEVEMYEAT